MLRRLHEEQPRSFSFTVRIKFGLKLKLKSTLPVVRLCDNPFTLEGAGARGLADSASYRVCRGFVRHGVYEGFGGATFILCSTLSLLEILLTFKFVALCRVCSAVLKI